MSEGLLFGFVVEKNPDLPEGDPRRVFKGRVVFQGNSVVNQHWEAAMFQDLGNTLATMEASRIADYYGCLPGHGCEQSDAEQAYIQAAIEGTPTWASLPQDPWPRGWSRMKRLVRRLHRAIFGHPGSGIYWEEHCDQEVISSGFVPMLRDMWQSCYCSDQLRLRLVVYVDEFKLVGPVRSIITGWSLLQQGLDMVHQGCLHERSVSYNMQALFEDCVAHCVNITGYSRDWGEVPTPVWAEDHETSEAGRVSGDPTKADSRECPWCRAASDIGSLPPATDGSSTMRSARTEEARGDEPQPNFGESGSPDRQLHIVAAKFFMHINYAARFAHPKWDHVCDNRLLRLVSYIQSTLDYRLKGWLLGIPRRNGAALLLRR